MAVTDGLDGLAGGTTLIAFIAYGIIGFIQGQEFVATFAFIIAGSNLGFLWYNAHPALRDHGRHRRARARAPVSPWSR